MSTIEPNRTWASSSDATPDTAIRRGASSSTLRAHAPPPRRAHQRSCSAGAETTAAWSSPSCSTARSVPNSGHAADEVVGAVDRVDVPACPGLAGLGPVLLADEPVIRERGAGSASGSSRSIAVSACGHERPVRLRRDLEVAPERAIGRWRRPRRRPRARGRATPRAPPPARPAVRRSRRRRTRRTGRAASADRPATRSRPDPLVRRVPERLADGLEADPLPKTSISPRVPIGASGGR